MTLTWLWWAWAVSNVTFMVFKFVLSALDILLYIQQGNNADANQYYRINIATNVVVYLLVPLLVIGFGIQLHRLFQKWGRAFSRALSATLRRIALGTIVVCICFVLRAVVLIMVLGDLFPGQVNDEVYLAYYLGLTAVPQVIALYIMAILLPRQHGLKAEMPGVVSDDSTVQMRSFIALHCIDLLPHQLLPAEAGVSPRYDQDGKAISPEMGESKASEGVVNNADFVDCDEEEPVNSQYSRQFGGGGPGGGGGQRRPGDDDESDEDDMLNVDAVWRTWGMRVDDPTSNDIPVLEGGEREIDERYDQNADREVAEG
eukprot:jgi/Bigna1/83005/fgenesh1_pg.100_\